MVNGQWSIVNGGGGGADCGAGAVLERDAVGVFCASGVAAGDSEWLMVNGQLSMVNGEGMTG